MKILIEQNQLSINPAQFMRQAGYVFINDRRTGKESFARSFNPTSNYPRFHVYIKDETNQIIIDLHPDQKQTSYDGHTMHNAEYDGELVPQEINRLRSLLRLPLQNPASYAKTEVKVTTNSPVVATPVINTFAKIGQGNLSDYLSNVQEEHTPSLRTTPLERGVKRSWWQRLFS